MRAEDKERLDKSKFFRTLSTELREQLTRAATVGTYSKGAVLWRRGDPAKYVFVVLSGRIGVFDTISDDRGRTVIDLFQPGDVIAGAPTLTKAPYLFTATAVEESRIVTIPVGVFRRYMRTEHPLVLATALNLVEAWQRLVIQIRSLKQFSTNQRLGCYLLALTNQKAGTASIRLTDDQLLIAGILGITRESLSRSFAQLRAHGVSKRGRIVTLIDVERLRVYCDSALLG